MCAIAHGARAGARLFVTLGGSVGWSVTFGRVWRHFVTFGGSVGWSVTFGRVWRHFVTLGGAAGSSVTFGRRGWVACGGIQGGHQPRPDRIAPTRD